MELLGLQDLRECNRFYSFLPEIKDSQKLRDPPDGGIQVLAAVRRGVVHVTVEHLGDI